MIFVYGLCVLYASVLLFFVLKPLYSSAFLSGNSSKLSTLLSGFSSEDELAEVLSQRDDLLAEAINHKLNELQQNKLIEILQRLKASGFPAFPSSVEKFLKLILLGVLALFWLPQPVLAQLPDIPTSEIVMLSEPSFLPSVNQYVLSPREGKLHVYYMGIVKKKPDAQQANAIALPFPPEVQELIVPDLPQASIEKHSSGVLLLKQNQIPDNFEIRAEFSLPASFGQLTWENSLFPNSSGVYLFLLPEVHGAFRAFLESIFSGANSWNVWPPRMRAISSHLKLMRQPDALNPEDPNYELLKKLPQSYTWNAIRMSKTAEKFPSFEVVGLAPSRMWLVVLGIVFALALFTTIALRFRRV
jgi:hypothetical protein